MISDTQTTIYIVCMGWLQTNKHFAGARCLWSSQCLRSNPGTRSSSCCCPGAVSLECSFGEVAPLQPRRHQGDDGDDGWMPNSWTRSVGEHVCPISLGSLVVTGCHQFFIFPEILGFDYHPNWRSHIFQRGGKKPPTSRVYRWYIYISSFHGIFLAIYNWGTTSGRSEGWVWVLTEC